MTTPPTVKKPALVDPDETPTLDPVALVRGFASLRRLTGMYPPGHPSIVQKLSEIDDERAAAPDACHVAATRHHSR